MQLNELHYEARQEHNMYTLEAWEHEDLVEGGGATDVTDNDPRHWPGGRR